MWKVINKFVSSTSHKICAKFYGNLNYTQVIYVTDVDINTFDLNLLEISHSVVIDFAIRTKSRNQQKIKYKNIAIF